jgi:hypothetical protein
VAVAVSLDLTTQASTIIWPFEHLPSDLLRAVAVPPPLGICPHTQREREAQTCTRAVRSSFCVAVLHWRIALVYVFGRDLLEYAVRARGGATIQAARSSFAPTHWFTCSTRLFFTARR